MRTLMPLLSLALFLVACDDGEDGDATPSPTQDATIPTDNGVAPDVAPVEPDATPIEPDAAPVEPDAAPGPVAVCSEPSFVTCEDQMILEMALQPDPAPGRISNDASDSQQGVWLSEIDATAGGAFANPPHAFVYGRFTDEGMEKVDIDDEAALESMDWDIAFRRYMIRLNGGESGPACVSAWRADRGAAFEDQGIPADDAYQMDQHYTPECVFVDDGSGLETSPRTALSSYYSYEGCVKMTERVYVLRLASGRLLKLQVLGYYTLDVQAQCQTTGQTPMPSGSGNMTVKWAFLN
ncbi:HmuY family protein [Myxococcota bacterium]|nr:HmuY family protein [Myxococcota bacterium]MBU1430612.1 HmuY family protein [Myxococcota bacterium]MBU1896847.1 HmuY family protein [Myxococcota bacterium]